MKTNQSRLKQILPKAISAFLVFWLSSVLVLICCVVMPVDVSAADDVPACHKFNNAEDDSDKISETEKEEADCCIFKPTKTLSSDLQKQQNVKQISAVTEKITLPTPVYFVKQSYKTPSVYHSAIRNRGSTHLIICNFRC